MVDISDDDVRRMVNFLQGMNLDYGLGREHQYVNCPNGPVLICLDAVLQIHRKYEGVVKPRLAYFQRNWPDIFSLSDLKQLIELYGHEGFVKVWNYQYTERVQTLELLVDWFLDYKRERGIDNDLEAIRHWARRPYSQPLSANGVRGIGIKTTQYIRILAGVDTVAPDTHILDAVNDAFDAFGVSAGPETAIVLLEAAAREMGVSARKLDYAIWKIYSGNKAGQQKDCHGRAICS